MAIIVSKYCNMREYTALVVVYHTLEVEAIIVYLYYYIIEVYIKCVLFK